MSEDQKQRKSKVQKMKLYLFVISGLTLASVSNSIDHSKFGPWFPATEGEPWPLPWRRVMGNNSLILRPFSFDIEVS